MKIRYITITIGAIMGLAGKIAGNFDLDCVEGTLTPQADASNSINVSFGNGLALGAEATPIYIAVPAGSYGTFTITGEHEMKPGDNYLWITYDIAETAKEGNTVDATITAYTIDGKEVAENNGNPAYSATIFLSEGAVLMPMDKGSRYYRIPSITVTKDGKRLVTLTDDRKHHNSDLPSHCRRYPIES